MAAALKYKTAEELEKAVEAYKIYCAGHVLEDEDGNPVLDRDGVAVVIDAHPPTVTGLAYFLGFKSRQALLNYQGRAQFRDVITRAKMWVEVQTEERLYDRAGQKGAQFSLYHNFRWKDEEKGEDTERGGVVLLAPVVQSPEKETGEGESSPQEAR